MEMPTPASGAPSTRSPNKRFWLACLFAPLPAVVAFFVAPRLAIPFAIVSWLSVLYWVLTAHAPSGRLRDVSPYRLVLVSVGLTLAFAVSLLALTALVLSFQMGPSD